MERNRGTMRQYQPVKLTVDLVHFVMLCNFVNITTVHILTIS